MKYVAREESNLFSRVFLTLRHLCVVRNLAIFVLEAEGVNECVYV